MSTTVTSSASRDRESSPDEITALARGLAVLRRIAAADAPVSNRELTELTGIPKPTVSRITATLVSAGFLFQLPDSERFVLTASVLELSHGFLRNFDIRARSRPFMIELAERTSLSVHLAVRDRLDMVAIDVVALRGDDQLAQRRVAITVAGLDQRQIEWDAILQDLPQAIGEALGVDQGVDGPALLLDVPA